MLSSLTPREERVLRMRFGIGEKSDHTLEEVGQDFEVTRGGSAVEAKALRKMRPEPQQAAPHVPRIAGPGRRTALTPVGRYHN